MPTPQGPFWSYKTYAYFVFRIVAFYKVVRMDGQNYYTRRFYMKLRNAIGVDPDSKGMVCWLC